MKHFYRLISFLVVICLVPALFVSAESTEYTAPPSVNVSYSEFSANLDYYRNLSKNYGYVIYINCTNDEYIAMQNLLSHKASGSDNLVTNINSRSSYVPTTYWNVATQGAREINGASAKDTLYSSKLFYGCTSYEIVIQNLNPNSLQFQSHGGSNDFVCSIVPGYTAYLSLNTRSTSKDDAFYLSFNAPCYVYGYVGAA